MPLDMWKDAGGNKQAADLISKLPEDRRVSLLALCGDTSFDKVWMHRSPLVDHGADPLGIVPRNYLGIYLKCARLNLSCAPNAVRASDQGNVMSVVSQKNITAGEEITISYLDDNLAVATDREQQMRAKIGVG